MCVSWHLTWRTGWWKKIEIATQEETRHCVSRYIEDVWTGGKQKNTQKLNDEKNQECKNLWALFGRPRHKRLQQINAPLTSSLADPEMWAYMKPKESADFADTT